MTTRLTFCLGLAFAVGCSSPTTAPPEDSGTDSGHPQVDAGPPESGSDAGTTDAGEADGGTNDAGMTDGGTDAGCFPNGVADRLTFATAPQSLEARTCSGALRVQLSDRCGAAVTAGAPVTVTFGFSSTTTGIFGDGQCLGAPGVFQIPAGSSFLEVFISEVAQVMTTVTASSAGLISAMQTEAVTCPANEKDCGGTSCIPVANCCLDADCVAPKSVCGTSGACRVPACSGFAGGCTSYVAYSSTTPAGTITFNGSGYAPSCMHVGSSQTVTFSGDFFFHPLEQTCGPTELTITGFGSTRSVKTGSFGNYGFRCKSHPAFEKGALQTP